MLALPMLCSGGITLADTADHFDRFKLRATIQIPNDKTRNPDDKMTAIDVGFWDKPTRRFYLSDRTNGGIDVIDTKANRFLFRIGGFKGEATKEVDGKVESDHDHSGPNGVVTVGNGAEVWAADGDSSVKVVDVKTRKIVDVVSTGGEARADEIAYDPDDEILLAVNNAEEITSDPESGAFATLISTKKGHDVLAKLVFHNASAGLEQAVWDAKTKRFYLSVPELDDDPTKGAIAVIDPKAAKVTDMFPIEECQSAGLALGPNGHLLVGCSGDAIEAGFEAKSIILDIADGKVVTSISDVGGSDEVWYNPGDHRFYLAARDDPNGPALGVIDARSSKWIGNVPTATDAKEVVVDSTSNEVYVALTPLSDAFANDKARGLACKHGCVGVYAETPVQVGCGPNPAGSN